MYPSYVSSLFCRRTPDGLLLEQDAKLKRQRPPTYHSNLIYAEEKNACFLPGRGWQFTKYKIK
ncbi:hypothetical protein BLA28_16935 [Eisenbergiella tayi]|nr:hypothetical protein BEI62_32630 [Eisenbergiella tayi]ODR31802.1 hypothetical protein BEI60_28745 [Eisenbergiella tayi]OIZ63583.1 hypothetical protein BLA28_16935 [Eisenbergiella tayi]RJW36945.1 hypothetical protein DXB25_30910 [Lachnospiraceae bacterium OM02-31]RJW50782.1 hypothetical protein DXB24_31025 [Lachnospiraceae bacterium OM02-3]